MEGNVDRACDHRESGGVDNPSRTRVTKAKLRHARAPREVTEVKLYIHEEMGCKRHKVLAGDSPAGDVGGAASVTPPLRLHSSVTNANEGDASDVSGGDMIVGRERLWSGLPEEIVHLILRLLPPAAHCRFRSVCKGWNRLLSSVPDWKYWKRTGTSCSVVTTNSSSEIRYFCHSDEKCLSLPQNVTLNKYISFLWSCQCDYMDWQFVDVNWRLVDVDKGIFCLHAIVYGLLMNVEWRLVDVDKGMFCCRAIMDGRVHLAVCNPIAGSFSFTALAFETFEYTDFKLRLLADPDKKSFRIIYTEPYSREFLVYRSNAGGTWEDLADFFPEEADSMFVWKNIVYAYSTNSTGADILFAFDLTFLDSELYAEEAPSWDKICVKFPDGEGDRFILSDRDHDQVMLVQSYCGETSCVNVWRLREKGTSQDHRPDFSFPTWENLDIGQKVADVRDLRRHRLVNVCCGPGHVCFIFRAGLVANAVNQLEPDICVKYSFVSGRPSVIECPSGWSSFERVFFWEPDCDAPIFDETMKISGNGEGEGFWFSTHD